jgi:hypothetical protein
LGNKNGIYSREEAKGASESILPFISLSAKLEGLVSK